MRGGSMRYPLQPLHWRTLNRGAFTQTLQRPARHQQGKSAFVMSAGSARAMDWSIEFAPPLAVLRVLAAFVIVRPPEQRFGSPREQVRCPLAHRKYNADVSARKE